jgi:hypothetical protein
MTLRGKAGAYGMPCLIEIFIGDLGCESLSLGNLSKLQIWLGSVFKIQFSEINYRSSL